MNTIRTRLQSFVEKTGDENIKSLVSEILNAGQVYGLNENELVRISIEKLSPYESKNVKVKSFLSTEKRLRKLFDMGIHASVDRIIKESGVSKFPHVKTKFDWYSENSQIKPDYLLIESYLGLLNENTWDSVIKEELSQLLGIRNSLTEDIMVKSTIDAVKSSNNKFIYEGIVNKLENYLITKTGTDRKLMIDELSKYKFDTRLNSLANNLKLVENSVGGFNLIDNDAKCELTPVVSPVKITESWDYFTVNGNYFKKNGKTIKRIDESAAQKYAPEVVTLNKILSSPSVRVSNTAIDFYIGKNVLSIDENKVVTWNGEACGGIEGAKQKVFSAALISSSVGAVMSGISYVYENFDSIMEIDFAKNIESKINNGLKISIINGKKFIANKVDQYMNENKVYEFEKVSSLKKFVYDNIAFDISESFVDVLDEENQVIVRMEKEAKDIKSQIDTYQGELEKIKKAKALNENVGKNQKVLDLEFSISNEIQGLMDKFSKVTNRIKFLKEELDGTRNPLDILSPGVKIQMKGTGEKGTLLSINETNNKLFVLLETGKQIECASGDLSVIDSIAKFHDGAQKDDVSVRKQSSGFASDKKKANLNSIKESAAALLETTRVHASSNDVDNSDQLSKRSLDKVEGINLNPSMYVKHPDYGDVLDKDIEGFEASAKAGEEMEGDPSALFNYDGVSYTNQPEEESNPNDEFGFEEFDTDADATGTFDDSESLVDDNPIQVPDEMSDGFGFEDVEAEDVESEESSEESEEETEETEETESEEESKESEEEKEEDESEENEEEKEEEKEETESEEEKEEDEEEEESESVKEAVEIYRWLMEGSDEDSEEKSIRPSDEDEPTMDFTIDSDDEDELSGSYGGSIEEE